MQLKRQKGFTLLELVITLVVIGIVGISVSVLWPGTKANVYDQTQQLVTDLRYVRSLAMAKEEKYRVNFSSSQYTFTELDGTTATPHPAASGSNVITLPSGMTLTTTNLPNGYIVFNKDGEPLTDTGDPGTALASSAVITISGGGTSDQATITPVTGAVLNPS
jgi:prepilin-type N-terminal cleavage/methylation domain-containing protein